MNYPSDLEKAAYDLLPCGIVWTDDKQRITFINKLLSEMLGYDSEQLAGERRFYELLSIGGKLYFESHVAPALVMDGKVRETNFEMIDEGGNRHPVIVNVSRSPSGDGYVYVVFPSKDRKKYEQELKRAQLKAETAGNAKSIFISSMSHEIRTPLHAILEAGNFLLKDNPRPDQLEFIQILRNAGSSLLGIVNDILDVSKLEAGMIVLDERPVHADQLVQRVMDTYGPTCREKGIVLRSVLPAGDVPLLLADSGKILQVLNNLVSNAVKFTKEGEVVVSLDHEEERGGEHKLSFRVRDTGIGIADDRLKLIFDPFIQATESTQTEYGGTGLGLAICKKILEACGADLKVRSKRGKGAEFYFSLILKAASVAEREIDQRSETPSEALPPLSHLRVLNVDDNRSNLLINARYFTEWELLFDQVASGSEALERLESKSYDIVLLDLRMPDMNGYELAGHIRAHPDAAVNNLPLIALSASASQEVSTEMLSAGINGLVVKPFDPTHLYQVIRQYGQQRKSGRIEHQLSYLTEVSKAVDFSKVEEIFSGEEAEYISFLNIIKDDVAEAKQILKTCTVTFSKKDFGNLKHNLLSTMRVFMLDELAQAFQEGKDALEAEDRKKFLVVIDRLVTGLDAFGREVVRVLGAG